MARKKSLTKRGIFPKLLRSVVVVVILSSLILGVSYFVKAVSFVNVERVVQISAPLLAKLGIDDKKAGKVAGEFAKRVSDTGVRSRFDLGEGQTLFTVAIMADSHNDNQNLTLALGKAKDMSAAGVFFLGDFTDLGVISDLSVAKEVMDTEGLSYYALPGDRDLWQSVGTTNFIEVFDKTYQSVSILDTKFVMLDNSANYTPIDPTQLEWFRNEVADADFVMVSTPLYHPTNDRVMGRVNGEEIPVLKQQADEILKIIRESKVMAVFSAEHHQSSRSKDPQKPELEHVVVGALASERNIQTPRFSMLLIDEDGSYKIEEVMLK